MQRSKNTKKNNLLVVTGLFKSAASKRINQLNDTAFKWQKSFYGRMIRIGESLNNIREYIANNPCQGQFL